MRSLRRAERLAVGVRLVVPVAAERDSLTLPRNLHVTRRTSQAIAASSGKASMMTKA